MTQDTGYGGAAPGAGDGLARPGAPAAKDRLRREFLTLRAALGARALSLGELVQKRVVSSPTFQDAGAIMVYLAFRGEVRTDLIIREGLRLGKRVTAPLTLKAGRRLIPHLLSGCSGETRPGAYGINEPVPGLCPAVSPAELELVIVPGVAFDERGGRLGYGGGYYDRFLLSEAPRAIRAALSFGVQVSPSPLPLDVHDALMDFVFTEERTIRGDRTGRGREAR